MRVLTTVAGVVLTLAGVVLLFIPGPGIPLIIVGLALLGRTIPAVKRLEEKLRRKISRREHTGEEVPPERPILS